MTTTLRSVRQGKGEWTQQRREKRNRGMEREDGREGKRDNWDRKEKQILGYNMNKVHKYI